MAKPVPVTVTVDDCGWLWHVCCPCGILWNPVGPGGHGTSPNSSANQGLRRLRSHIFQHLSTFFNIFQPEGTCSDQMISGDIRCLETCFPALATFTHSKVGEAPYFIIAQLSKESIMFYQTNSCDLSLLTIVTVVTVVTVVVCFSLAAQFLVLWRCPLPT